MPGLGSLVSGLRPVSSVKRGEIYLLPAKADGGGPDPGQARKFQYFPNSIQDTKAVTYQTKEVPGGSLPIYQWTNSGERQISFTVFFTTDVDHYLMSAGGTLAAELALSKTLGIEAKAAEAQAQDAVSTEVLQRLKAAGAQSRNPYIPGAIMWLRSFMLPTYSATATTVGVPLTFPPRKMWLVVPGSGIDLTGGVGGFSGQSAGVFCHMSSCDVTYESFFPSGNPRVAQVSLVFTEDAQNEGAVKFPQRGQAFDDAINTWYASGFAPSGISK